MKRLMLAFILGIGCLMASAQRDRDYEREYDEDDQEIRTLFSNGRSNGGYGALSLSYTELEGKDAFMVGARGAWIIDHAFAIGLGGRGFINDLDHHDWMDNGWLEDDFNDNLAGGYGGIYLEPIFAPRWPVHLSFPILIGAGGIARVANEEYWDQRWMYDDRHEDAFFVLEPSVELEFNVTRHMRFAGTLGYRFTSRIEMENTDPDVMEGLNVGLIMKFGKF